MALKLILVAAVLGIAGAVPTKSALQARVESHTELGRNNNLEILIINAIEDFRKTMITGSDSIPVLDPLQVDHIYADDSTIPIEGAQVEIRDLIVTKLSTFDVTQVVMESVSVIPVRYRFLIRGEIPEINVEVGSYDLFINFWGLNIFGKGDTKLNIYKPWIKVEANMGLRYGFLAVYLNILDMRIEFGLDDIQFNVTGLFGNPSVDDFVNRFLRNLILEFATNWMDTISDFISPEVQAVANDILSDINLIGIIG